MRGGGGTFPANKAITDEFQAAVSRPQNSAVHFPPNYDVKVGDICFRKRRGSCRTLPVTTTGGLVVVSRKKKTRRWRIIPAEKHRLSPNIYRQKELQHTVPRWCTMKPCPLPRHSYPPTFEQDLSLARPRLSNRTRVRRKIKLSGKQNPSGKTCWHKLSFVLCYVE